MRDVDAGPQHGSGELVSDQDGHDSAPAATAPYRFAEQHTPPPAQRVSEVAQTTFEHVFEVDPRLMEVHVLQQVSQLGNTCCSTWTCIRRGSTSYTCSKVVCATSLARSASGGVCCSAKR